MLDEAEAGVSGALLVLALGGSAGGGKAAGAFLDARRLWAAESDFVFAGAGGAPGPLPLLVFAGGRDGELVLTGDCVGAGAGDGSVAEAGVAKVLGELAGAAAGEGVCCVREVSVRDGGRGATAAEAAIAAATESG